MARNGQHETAEPGDGHLHFRVGKELSRELDRFAEKAGMTRSAAARVLLARALSRKATRASIVALRRFDDRIRELLQELQDSLDAR